jgi:gamma-glutamylcyclotransferase (GGCT)/AIG2-like uncharacterized protein YtfP
MREQTALYVAYGSNLNLAQMAKRCPTAKVVGASELQDMRLLFRGARGGAVGTVEPYAGSRVPVLVWEITPADETALDRYEDYPSFYRKEYVEVELGGKTVIAMIYIMNEESPNGSFNKLGQPGQDYYNVVLEGYKDAGFDEDILRQAAADSVKKDR